MTRIREEGVADLTHSSILVMPPPASKQWRMTDSGCRCTDVSVVELAYTSIDVYTASLLDRYYGGGEYIDQSNA